MPEHGLKWLSRNELLTYEEMFRICSILSEMGIEKIRITGGEPFVRKDLMKFLRSISENIKPKELTVTTNGVLTAPYIKEFRDLGIHSVNLSLDTLDRDRFFKITYRDEFAEVMNTLEQLLYHNIEVKLNAVVMNGKNTQDIVPLVALAKDSPVSVRFIEEMPFNGVPDHWQKTYWNYERILETIKETYPDIQKIPDPPYSTSLNYQIPGHKGNIGIIPAYTRSFCGTCNRIRITPEGIIKTCLYDNGGLNYKELTRNGKTDKEISSAIEMAFKHKAKDGWEAEKNKKANNGAYESMAVIGG